MTNILILIGSFVAIIILFAFIRSLRDRKMVRFSVDMGLVYEKKNNNLISQMTFLDFEFFNRRKEGCYMNCKNILRGSHENEEILVFDYLWKGNPDRQSDTLNEQTIIAVRSSKNIHFVRTENFWEIEARDGWCLLSQIGSTNSGRSHNLIPVNRLSEEIGSAFQMMNEVC